MPFIYLLQVIINVFSDKLPMFLAVKIYNLIYMYQLNIIPFLSIAILCIKFNK